MTKRVVLYRRGCNSHQEDDAEIAAAQSAGFTVVFNRTAIPKDSFVIPRYSVYPFAKELFEDIRCMHAVPINSFQQFQYIADLKEWVGDLEGMTPETWGDVTKIPEVGPFILKGETNSRKGDWKTMMYAEDKFEALQVHRRLSNDGLIGQQHIYIRKFEELVKYGDSITGMPIAKEFRFFVNGGKVMSGGYYWSSVWESNDPMPSIDEVDGAFLNEAIKRIERKCNAFVIDVAKKANGEWTVIELNAIEQSGLSANDPTELYKRLFDSIDENR